MPRYPVFARYQNRFTVRLTEGEKSMTGAPVIHVVDDDASYRTAISRLLKVSGYEVADYESAASFLRALENARPGCILLDVKCRLLAACNFRSGLRSFLIPGPSFS